jgi:uncharacterized repeat protein (TIGR01451 family)
VHRTSVHRPIPARRPTPARRPVPPRRGRAVVALTALLAVLGVPLLLAAPATAETGGAITALALTVTDDGTAGVGGIDLSATNGLVATNNAVTMSWEVEAADLVDGQFEQTLPEGWSWVAGSLGKLTSSSSLYTASHTVSADGRTLTATLSIPGVTLVSLSGLQAVPAPTVADGSTSTPTLTATDGTSTRTATGRELTVVSVPQAELGFYYASRTDTTYDFGAGTEAAVRVQPHLLYRAQTSLVGQRLPLELTLPQRLTIDYDGPEPAAVTACEDGSSALLELVSMADGQLVIDLVGQPTSALAAPSLCLWYPSSQVGSGSAAAETLALTLADPEPTTTDGTAVIRTGNDTLTAQVYDGSEPVVTPPRPAVLTSSKIGGWNWSSYKSGPVLPATSVTSPGWSQAPSYVASGGTMLATTGYIPAYDYASQTSVGTEDLVGYAFWDPQAATLVGDASTIFVGQYRTAIDASTYRIEFTNTQDTTDPGTANTWSSSVEEAGGTAAVSGVRVVYLAGAWATGTTSGTASQMSLNVPLLAREDGTVTSVTARYVWTAAGDSALRTSTSMVIRPFNLTATLQGSATQIVSGSPFTYRVLPSAGGSVTDPPDQPDYPVSVTLTVTLPSTVLAVDLSDATAQGWTLISETPAELGPDGLPGTSDDGDGIVLVLGRDTVVPATGSADLPAFSLPTTTSLHAPSTGKMTARLSVVAAMTDPTQSISASTSLAATVLQAETLTMDAATATPRIAVTDDTASWSTRWYNYTSRDQDAVTTVLAVLPYVGDGRGTTTSGTVALTGAVLRGDALASGTVEVTTADPTTIGAAPGDGATWVALDDAGDLSAVTAVRVRLTGLAVGADGGLDLTVRVTEHQLGDVLVGSATAVLEGSSLGLATDDVPVVVTGATVAGRVLTDPARDGLVSAPGEPAADVLVRLLDGDGATALATTTDADGAYTFDGVGAGTYRVEVDASTIPGTSVVPTVDPDGVLDGGTEVTVAGLQVVDGLDFAFAVRNPALTLVTAPEPTAAAPVVGDTVTFTSTVTNTGDTVLTAVQTTGCDAAEPIADLAVGASATCTTTRTLTQTDLDAGTVTAAVQVTATDDIGTPVHAESEAGLTVPGESALTVAVVGSAPADLALGAQVTWTATVENAGLTTVRDLTLSDTLGSGWTVTWPGEPGVLAPGEQAVGTATATLTQDLLDAGAVTTEVTASGTSPRDAAAVEASGTVTVAVPLPGAVSVVLLLDGRPAVDSADTLVAAGSTLAWTYRVTNTGAVTLHDVRVVVDGSEPGGARATTDQGVSLAPGQSVDLDATSLAPVGRWEHAVTATAAATGAGGQVTGSDSVRLTGTLVVAEPPADASADGPGSGSVPDGQGAADATGTGGAGTNSVLAVTGAPTAALAALGLLLTGLGLALARVRRRRSTQAVR